jgi:hypothetical protein
VDVLGDGLQLVVGEASEGVLHHLEVAVEVAGPRLVDAGQELRCSVCGQEVTSAVEGPGLHAPGLLLGEDLARQVAHCVGDEGAGDASLDVTLGAVVEESLGGGHRGSRVGQVVGEDLVVVDRAGGGETG